MQSRSSGVMALMPLSLPCSFHPPALSASPVSIFPSRLPQSWTLIWLWISASFAISRQNVISANLTTSQVDNSTGYVVTLAVSNLISQCIVVSEELEEKKKCPPKQFQSFYWYEVKHCLTKKSATNAFALNFRATLFGMCVLLCPF